MNVSSSSAVVGVGMTSFGKYPERSVRSLAEEAVSAALTDAGITAADVGMVFFGNAAAGVLTAQEMIRGQSALRNTGLLGAPIVNVENACATASTAFAMACMAVSSGLVDVALAIGAERLSHPQRERSLLAIATAVDLEQNPTERAQLEHVLLGLPAAAGSEPDAAGRSKFMEIYADETREYFERTGATAHDLAVIAAKNRSNGALNPHAHYGARVTPEEVLASRMIADPLTLLMCSPVSDGAAAVVVCSPEYASRLAAPAIEVRAVALNSGRDTAPGEPNVVQRTSQQAYEAARLGPDDLGLIELHDAAAPGELILYEDLALCAPGDGPKLLHSGDTAIGGRIPVNPSGGLMARGHPIGATGCAQIVELVTQLRGRAGERQVGGVRTAMAQNSGGNLDPDSAACVVTILAAPSGHTPAAALAGHCPRPTASSGRR